MDKQDLIPVPDDATPDEVWKYGILSFDMTEENRQSIIDDTKTNKISSP